MGESLDDRNVNSLRQLYDAGVTSRHPNAIWLSPHCNLTQTRHRPCPPRGQPGAACYDSGTHMPTRPMTPPRADRPPPAPADPLPPASTAAAPPAPTGGARDA
jgi:hypothetical protein